MSFENYEPRLDRLSAEFSKEVLYHDNLKHAFDYFDASHWIDTFRVEDDHGAIDIDKTADAVGVPVNHELPIDEDGRRPFAYGYTEGLDGDKPIAIYLDHRYREFEIKLTFGHELGHLFLKKVTDIDSLPGGQDKKVEAFCDYFGLQMALPVDKIEHINEVNADVIADTVRRYNIGHFAVMHQFMESGALPKRMLFDTSNGDVSNPLYSNKVAQKIICYDCHIEKPHEQVKMPLRIDALDLTKYDWSQTTRYIGCRATDFGDLQRHRLLNISHGRWSDKDDRLMEEELRKKHSSHLDLLPSKSELDQYETLF